MCLTLTNHKQAEFDQFLCSIYVINLTDTVITFYKTRAVIKAHIGEFKLN